MIGCGSQESGNNAKVNDAQGKDQQSTPADPKPQEKPPEPVTLKFHLRTVLDDFEKYVNQYVKQKFPHVTLELIESQPGSTIQDLIAANDIPDIIWEGLTNLRGVLSDLDVPTDLTPLAKEHGFDFGVYAPNLVESIKSYSTNGEIIYLPYNVLVFALHYNTDIFDKFGVDYPQDNLTWDDVIELGKRVTRKDGDIQYIGLRPPTNVNRLQSQLSLSYVDDQTDKATVNTEGWKRLLETFKSIHLVQEQPGEFKSLGSSRNEFLSERTVAMLPEILQLQNTDMVAMESEGLRWDIATYPVFRDYPEIGTGVFSDGFVLPKGGKNQDIAFQIIAFLSTNADIQLAATKDGRITALKDNTILAHAFENNPAATNKNIQAAFTLKYPIPAVATPYDAQGRTIINRKVLDYMNGKSDVNTLLKEAEEDMDKKVAEMKAAN